MNEKTFQIMYQALVEIASSPTFFDKEKQMARIAKKALQDIGKTTEEESSVGMSSSEAIAMDIESISPGFDGSYGWLTIIEAYHLFPQGKTWKELGFSLLKEAVAPDGTIFVLLQKSDRL